jgi:protein O-mannosyl-transferase
MSRPTTEQNPSSAKSASAVSSSRPSLLLRPAGQIGILLLLGFGIYLNTLQAPFIFDDHLCIVNNPAIRSFNYFFDFDLVRALHIPLDIQHSFALRPVVYLTFALNYLLGGTDEFGFHLVNIAIHLGSAVLVYLLVGVTLRLAPIATKRTDIPWNQVLPLLAALLFVAHPLQTQAVTYTAQRFTSLVAFFYFAALLLYIQAQQAQRPAWRRLCYGLALFITVMAMKSKETAFTLPAMLLLYELFFLAGTLRQRCYRLFPFFLTMAIIPATLFRLTQGNTTLLSGKTVDESMNLVNFAGVSRWDYLQTQFGVIVAYLRLLFLPIGQNFDPDYRLAQGFFEWRVAGALLLLLSLLGYACFLAFRSFREEQRYGERIIAFGIIWFFVTLSVESSIIPIDDLMLEYRLYLPSFGIFLALVTTVGLAVNRGTLPWRWGVGTALIIITSLAAATVARNDLYRDKIRLLEDVTTKSPDKPRAHSLLGVAYLLENRLAQAEIEFREVLRLRPNDANTMVNLGNVYFNKGEFATAIDQYQRSLELFPDNFLAHANLGMCYLNLGSMAAAEEELLAALAINPNFRDARSSIAHLYEILGRNAEAIGQYRKLLEFFPDDQDARKRLQSLAGHTGLN